MRSLLVALQLLVLAAPRAEARQETEFGRLIARLSEAGGFFDSDNLVSNETSYLHVIPAFKQLKIQGGAYLGVGPEQSFSYLAEIKPEVALLIDIRRDNMLLHLLFRAMFTARGIGSISSACSMAVRRLRIWRIGTTGPSTRSWRTWTIRRVIRRCTI